MVDNNIYTISQYVESAPNLAGRIVLIDSIIDALILKTLDAVGSAIYDEVNLNDGQMTVRTKYRTVEDVFAGIAVLEKMKQLYANRINGRTFRMVSGNIMPLRGGC